MTRKQEATPNLVRACACYYCLKKVAQQLAVCVRRPCAPMVSSTRAEAAQRRPPLSAGTPKRLKGTGVVGFGRRRVLGRKKVKRADRTKPKPKPKPKRGREGSLWLCGVDYFDGKQLFSANVPTERDRGATTRGSRQGGMGCTWVPRRHLQEAAGCPRKTLQNAFGASFLVTCLHA